MATKSVGTRIWIKGVCFELVNKFRDEWHIKNVDTMKDDILSNEEFDLLYQCGKLTYFSIPSKTISDTIQNPNGNGRVANLLEHQPQEKVDFWKNQKYLCDSYLRKYNGIRSQRSLQMGLNEFWKSAWGKMPSPPTFHRWLKRYVENGKDIRSFACAHAFKGNSTPRKSEEFVECCRRAYENIYLNPRKGTLDLTLAQAVVNVKEANSLRPLDEQIPLPTMAYIQRLSNTYDMYEKVSRREGQAMAENLFRNSVHGIICERPLDRIEIDHTRLDGHCIDALTGLPMERPWLTVVLDVKTRSILGYWLSFDPPSQYTIVMALRMALMPKTGLRAMYPGMNFDWIQYGKPKEVGVDNGLDFHGNSFIELLLILGITVKYSPRKKAWFKGHVEKAIRTFNTEVMDGKPGRTGTSINDRGEYQAKQKATMTIELLRQIITEWIVNIYHQRTHHGSGQKPHDDWVTNMPEDQIPLIHDASVINQVVGISEKRRVSTRGIDINSLRYNCDALGEMRQRHGDHKGVMSDVSVKWSPEDLGHITVFGPEGVGIRVPVVTTWTDYATQLTNYQHQVCRAYSKKYLEGRDDVEALSEAKVAIHELAMNAGKNRRKMKNMPTAHVRSRMSPATKIVTHLEEVVGEVAVEVSAEVLIANQKPRMKFRTQSNFVPT